MYMKSLPAEWIIVRNAMQSFDPPLLLRNTDQSFLTDGEVSISHIINMSSHNHLQISKILDGKALRLLRMKGHLTLKDIRFWLIYNEWNNTGKIWHGSDPYNYVSKSSTNQSILASKALTSLTTHHQEIWESQI